MKIVLVTYPIFDFVKNQFGIGGVQTYVKDLCALALSLKYEVVICQIESFKSTITCANVDGVEIKSYYSPKRINSNRFQKGFNRIYSDYKADASLFIVTTDQMGIKCSIPNGIVIQHGINFDSPGNYLPGLFGKYTLLWPIYKLMRCIRNSKRFSYVHNTVCVDYNYVNWLRTLVTIPCNHDTNVILNYASSHISKEDLYVKINKERETYKIVFARRFTSYRGAILFANVIKRLLPKYDNIDITFAGDGPLKKDLVEMFSKEKRIHFTSYSSSESVQFHKQFDIAVVPTIYSEGSSLSLCEAMAAGCFPIASLVGGMSNMILNNYNGVLFYPTEENLYNALEKTLNLPKDKFDNIVKRAYETSKETLSIERWRNEWTAVFSKY